MTVEASADMAQGGAVTRKQRERQLLDLMRNDPMQIYAAYLARFGTGDADAPTLTPRAMVKQLLESEFPENQDS